LVNNYNFHNNFHKPVLLDEVIKNLQIQEGEIYVDGTFGAGGYSAAILNSKNCTLYSFDRDSNVIKFADNLKEKYQNRFRFINDKFSNMKQSLNDLGVDKVDGIVLDIGVSSMQLDENQRGFSFNSSAKLDMRMDNNSGISAFDVVNQKSELELSKIIKDLGEEKKHRQIAKKIVLARQEKEITTALDLAQIVRDIYGKYNPKKIDPATKTFQAIRIFVNDELGELEKVLDQSLELLKKGGRLLVVSFHSLEDSYVKKFMRKNSGYDDRNISRYDPANLLEKNNQYQFSLPILKAIKPSKSEIEDNSRARSSRLRIAIKN